MKRNTRRGVGVVAGLAVGAGLFSLGYDTGFTDGSKHEQAPRAATSPSTAEAETSEPSLRCFSLGVLRDSLGPDGTSSLHIFGDNSGVYGEVYADADEVRNAATLVRDSLDPDSSGVVDASPSAVQTLAAASTSEAALPSIYAEGLAAKGLGVQPENLTPYLESDARREAQAMLDQARQETVTALEANDCLNVIDAN